MQTEKLTFGQYEVKTRPDGSPWELGRGGMGITYLAVDTNLGSDVVLKLIGGELHGSETHEKLFQREARAAARINHHNVAKVFHLGKEGERFFYVMEYVDGKTLEQFVRERGNKLEVSQALQLIQQVNHALIAAEKCHLVHRDIKPANIMIVEGTGGELLVKVIDFGLAKVLEGGAKELSLLTGGQIVGTPAFASPEQIEGREVDIRSDIYSLGVTFWNVLTGTPPFSGSPANVMGQHLYREPDWGQLAGAPGEIRTLLEKMLAKDPGLRFQSPLDLEEEIRRLRGQSWGVALPGGAALSTKTLVDPSGRRATSGNSDMPTIAAGSRRGAASEAHQLPGSRAWKQVTVGICALTGVTLMFGIGWYVWKLLGSDRNGGGVSSPGDSSGFTVGGDHPNPLLPGRQNSGAGQEDQGYVSPITFDRPVTPSPQTQGAGSYENGTAKDRIAVTLATDKRIYVKDDVLQFTVKTDQDCYLRVYHRNVNGEVLQIFPNRYQQENFVKAGTTVRIPAEGQGYRMRVGEPYGEEQIKAVASSSPFADRESFVWTDAPYNRIPAVSLQELNTRGVKFETDSVGETSISYEVRESTP